MNEIVDLNLGIFPEAAVSGAVCLQTENDCVLIFNAMKETSDGRRKDAGVAIFEFERCLLTRFGWPNDEPRWHIPFYRGTGYGIYEVRQSEWIRQMVQGNRHGFPDTRDDYVRKHLLFNFHDSTFECLTDDFSFRLTNKTHEAMIAAYAKKLF